MSVKKAATAALMSACVAGGLLTVAAPAAEAAPRKACVNKKSGELRILLKAGKKCKKGWSKISFDEPGATGATGTPGGAGATAVVNVKDATGAIIGNALFDGWQGLISGLLVYTQDGAYRFSMTTGEVLETDESVYYLDAACSPTAAVTDVYNTQQYLGSLTSFGRIVERPTGQAVRAYKGTSTVRAVPSAEKFWYLDYDGTCKDRGYQPMSTLAVLEPVPAPADRPAPLSIG